MTNNRDAYMQAVLARAEQLNTLEAAAMRLPSARHDGVRGWLAALLAALLALYPSVSAAAGLLF